MRPALVGVVLAVVGVQAHGTVEALERAERVSFPKLALAPLEQDLRLEHPLRRLDFGPWTGAGLQALPVGGAALRVRQRLVRLLHQRGPDLVAGFGLHTQI